ncbi:hypothetical protein CsSME_00007769 [Camellia sinensis var. sinensis]
MTYATFLIGRRCNSGRETLISTTTIQSQGRHIYRVPVIAWRWWIQGPWVSSATEVLLCWLRYVQSCSAATACYFLCCSVPLKFGLSFLGVALCWGCFADDRMGFLMPIVGMI